MTISPETRASLRRRSNAYAAAASEDDGEAHPFESFDAAMARRELEEIAADLAIPLLDALEAAEAERDRMRTKLRDIADPIGYLRRYAEEQGGQFNGAMAHHIITPHFLSKMAAAALGEQP